MTALVPAQTHIAANNHLRAHALTEEPYKVLQGEFAGGALRQLSEIKGQITEEISPAVWREALGIFGEKEEEEE